GVLVSRTLACHGAPDCQDSTRTYVYAGLLLLEEYEGTDSRARYYYADQGDIPVAADLWDATQSALRRVYYVVDRMGSIIAVLHDQGAFIERVTYDPYGRPTIEPTDTMPPEVSTVRLDNGALLVAFSEMVLPPPISSPAPNIESTLEPVAHAM